VKKGENPLSPECSANGGVELALANGSFKDVIFVRNSNVKNTSYDWKTKTYEYVDLNRLVFNYAISSNAAHKCGPLKYTAIFNGKTISKTSTPV